MVGLHGDLSGYKVFYKTFFKCCYILGNVVKSNDVAVSTWVATKVVGNQVDVSVHIIYCWYVISK